MANLEANVKLSSDSMKELNELVENLKKSFDEILNPAKTFSETISDSVGFTSDLLSIVDSLSEKNWDLLKSFNFDKAKDIGNQLKSKLGGVLTEVGDFLADQSDNSVMDNIGDIFDDGFDAIGQSAENWCKSIGGIFEELPKNIKNLPNKIGGIVKKICKEFKEIDLSAPIKAIKDFATEFISNIKSFPSEVKANFEEVKNSIKERIIDSFDSAEKSISDMVSSFKEKVSDIKNKFSELKEMGLSGIWDKFKDGFANACKSIGGKISDLGPRLNSSISGFGEKLEKYSI